MNRFFTLAFFLLLSSYASLAQSPATAGSFTATCTDAGTVSWTNPGTVDNILVFAKAGSAITVGTPTDNISGYSAGSANSNFSLAVNDYQNDPDAFLVYRDNSTTNSFTLTGLTAGVTYHFLIFNASAASYSTALTFSGSSLAAPPNPTGFAASVANASSSISWTNATCGDEILIVGRQGASVTGNPTGNGSSYVGNLNFAAATAPDFDAAAKTIYRGTSSPQIVTNLINGTQYFFKIFTRKGTTWSSGVEVNITPAPGAITGGNLSNVCTNSATVNWTNPNPVNNILIFAKQGSAITVGTPTANISTYTSPSNNWSLPGTPYQNDASAFLIYNSTSGTSMNLTELNPGNTYHFLILNAIGTTYSAAHTFNAPTLTTPPVVTGVGNTPGGNSLSVNWTNPTSCIDEVLVIARSGSAVTATPTGNGSAYTANNTFGSGTPVSAGQFAVYKGTGNSVNILGLTNGTTYHVGVFTRRGTVWSAGVATSGVPVDATPPNVSTLNPVNAEPNFTMFGTQAVITFNENVQKIGGAASNNAQRVRIFENGSPVSTLDRNNSALSISGNQLTITLPTLKANTDYEIVVGNEVIEDLTGNDFTGIASGNWEFNTSGVTITAPATLNLCAGATAKVLGDIIIEETHPADFNGGGTFTLSFNPNSGFVFQSGTGTVTAEPVAGQDASISGLSVSFTSVTFTINLDGTNDETDRIRISGLRISSDGSTPNTKIRRSGGSATVGGNATVDNLDHANINAGTAVAAPSGPSTTAFTLCQGTSIGGSQATFASNNTNLRWYSDAAATSFLIQTQNPTATQLGLSSATAGTFTVYATQTTTCESAPTAINFVVNPRPVANGGSALPASCPGTSVTLGGSPILTTTTVGPYFFVWTGPGNPADVANPIHVLPDPGATNQTFTYILAVTDGNGCSSVPVNQNVLVRNINQTVTITSPTQFDYADNSPPVNLIGSPATNALFSGVGVVAQGDGSYKFNPALAGTVGSPHEVTYSTELANGCRKSTTRNFTVSPGGNVINGISANQQYCSDEGATPFLSLNSFYQGILDSYGTDYTVLGYVIDPIVTNAIQGASGFRTAGVWTAPQQRFYPNQTPSGDYFISSLVRYEPGVSDFNWVGVTVKINPRPVVTITNLNSIYCEENTNLIIGGIISGIPGNPVGGLFEISADGGATYTSSGLGLTNLGAGQAQFNPQTALAGSPTPRTFRIRYTYSPPGVGSDGNSCFDTDQKDVTVYPLPPLSFSNTLPIPPSCYFGNAILINVNNPSGGSVSFSGFGLLDNGNNTATFAPDRAFTQSGGGTNVRTITINARVISAQGCQRQISTTIDVYPPPTASFTYLKDKLCVTEAPINLTSQEIKSSFVITYLDSNPVYSEIIPDNNPTTPLIIQFDPAARFNDAVARGGNSLSDQRFKVDYTSRDGINCQAQFSQTFVVSPSLSLSINISNSVPSDEYCSNEGAKLLTLNPPDGRLFINNIEVPTISDPTGNQYLLASATGSLTPFNIRYEKTSGVAGCLNSTTRTVYLFPSPVADFSDASRCFDTNFSLVSLNNSNAVSWAWNMDDGTPIVSSNTVNHIYPSSLLASGFGSSRDFNVNLTIEAGPQGTSSRVCKSSRTRAITVGSLPTVSINFARVCEGDNTQFSVVSNLPLQSFQWNFGDGAVTTNGNTNDPIVGVTNTSGTFSNPLHQFATVNDFSVQLTARTSLGCPGTNTRIASILNRFDATLVNPGQPYLMPTINLGDGGWKVEDVNGNSTWEFGTNVLPALPDELFRIDDSVPSWSTNLTGTYLPNDLSYVNSPCFDLSAFNKPVISLQYWAHSDEGDDGAILQYSINGGTDWERLGNLTSGKDWFNRGNISAYSPPVDETLFGWSNRNQPNWAIGKHSLNDISNLQNVRFRMVFRSDAREELDGFAFGDVRIEERNRIMLVENFTNSTSQNSSANNTAFNALGSNEIVRIQYHTSFPGNDLFNLSNPTDNNARAAFYGISSSVQNSGNVVPRGYVDGVSQGNFVATWAGNYINLQSLVASFINVSIVDNTTPANASDGKVKATVNVRALEDILVNPFKSYRLFIAVVEKQAGSNRFVMRKMLPDAAGIPIPQKNNTFIMENGDAFGFTTDLTSISGFIDGTQLAFVAFVQDINSKDVLQSATIDFAETLDLVTGIENLAEYINIYPNPANESFEIELPVKADNRLMINVIDPVGRAAQQLYFEKGEQTKTVNTQNLAQGIYVVQIGSGKTGVVRKKVMVVH